MASAVIYARYSSHNQREESIEDQVRVCTEAAARNGDDIVRVYADKAISGTSTDKRAAFAEMIADSARGRWEKVYVYKTDRFARNRYDSAVNKAKLKRNGVRVVSATEGIQDGPDGILLEALLEGMAEYYSANLGENVRRGMHGNALKCKHNGVNVYGYDHGEDGMFAVNEHEARAVRAAFDMYDAGASMPEIVEALSPYRTRRGNPIRMQNLTHMLRNEKYAGVYEFKGVRVEGGMPQIVDVDVFERVQRRLALRMRKRRGVVEYLLAGKLFDVSGGRYQSSSGHNRFGKKYTYYHCPATCHRVPQREMEEAVAGAVAQFVKTERVAGIIADLVLEEQDEALLDDLKAMDCLRDRLKSNEREQARMVDLAAKTGATDAVAAKLDALVSEREAVERELRELERGTPVFDRDHIEFWVQEIMGKDDPLQVISLFVRRVLIDRENGEMRIEYTFGEPGGGVPEPPDPKGGGTDGGCSSGLVTAQPFQFCSNPLDAESGGFVLLGNQGGGPFGPEHAGTPFRVS